MNIGSFIWNIANDVLRGVYTRGKYRDIILPMTVTRLRPQSITCAERNSVCAILRPMHD
jgi:type I restriction enzyme M protein